MQIQTCSWNTNTSTQETNYTNTEYKYKHNSKYKIFQILYEQGDESKADEERHMIEMSSILEKFSRCFFISVHHCRHFEEKKI